MPGGLSRKAYLYFCNASSMIRKLKRLCSCTPRILSVLGSELRNASSRSCTWAHIVGSAGGSVCEMVGVFPNSSLETPASEDVGIAIQRHGCSIVRKADVQAARNALIVVTSSMWDGEDARCGSREVGCLNGKPFVAARDVDARDYDVHFGLHFISRRCSKVVNAID